MNAQLNGRLESKRILRLKDVLYVIPVSKSTWWNGVKTGRYPKSIKMGPRTTGWFEKDILDLIDNMS
jgi:predicted DNA-binding transcriptional regulator AlpA